MPGWEADPSHQRVRRVAGARPHWIRHEGVGDEVGRNVRRQPTKAQPSYLDGIAASERDPELAGRGVP